MFKTLDNFFPQATEMRQYFLDQFAEPREAHENRFVWDYWHIEDQYTLMRTPAYHYFPEELYSAFEDHLIQWGQKNLGCQSISPPWLSYYVDGGHQNLHADNPHGPWAFVFSLTDWMSKEFTGGETLLMNSDILNYWENFNPSLGLEHGDLLQEIPAHMNQLTLFDPRIPHGVKEVRGVKDPRKARLVVHGWFLEPSPYLEGALNDDEDNEEELGAVINDGLSGLMESLQDSKSYGSLVYRLDIESDGSIKDCHTLFNTLAPKGGDEHERCLKHLKTLKFPKANGTSELTLPIIFS